LGISHPKSNPEPVCVFPLFCSRNTNSLIYCEHIITSPSPLNCHFLSNYRSSGFILPLACADRPTIRCLLVDVFVAISFSNCLRSSIASPSFYCLIRFSLNSPLRSHCFGLTLFRDPSIAIFGEHTCLSSPAHWCSSPPCVFILFFPPHWPSQPSPPPPPPSCCNLFFCSGSLPDVPALRPPRSFLPVSPFFRHSFCEPSVRRMG